MLSQGAFSLVAIVPIKAKNLFRALFFFQQSIKISQINNLFWNISLEIVHFLTLCVAQQNKNNINKPFSVQICTFFCTVQPGGAPHICSPPHLPTYPPHPSTHPHCWEPSGSLRSAQVITIQRHQICLFYSLLVNHGCPNRVCPLFSWGFWWGKLIYEKEFSMKIVEAVSTIWPSAVFPSFVLYLNTGKRRYEK